jgi:serine/threonine-protein kinase
MNPNRWDTIKQLFHDALERAPNAREQFVAEMAGADTTLKDEVLALLAAHGRADEVFGDVVRTSPTLPQEGESPLAQPCLGEPCSSGQPVAMAAPSSARTTLPTAHIHSGRYRIDAELGRGGMGAVYRAHDFQLDRPVALKFLIGPVVGDDRALLRLRREATLASALNHPSICTIYELITDVEHPFIVMEFVEGDPLSAMIGGGALASARVVTYGIQLADALAHAHGRGVIHGDFKPANIMVRPDGRLKVLDFGIARRIPSPVSTFTTATTPPGCTHRSETKGTVAYMAPEALRGQPVDVRSDLWALGVVLFEMLAAYRPYDADTGYEIAAAILQAAPRPLPPSVEKPLASLALRCLEKAPDDRYQTAQDIVDRLRGVADSAMGTTVPRRGTTRLRAGQIRSIAVLPLEDLSPGDVQDYFADALTETLLTELTQISALRVISRTSVMHYRRAPKPVPDVARELGVDAIIAGSVQRAAERVRITIRLIHAASDTHLWARSFERDLRDLLTLQGEVAREIGAEIKVRVRPREGKRLAAARPVRREAQDAYLRGIYHFDRLELDRGMQLFQQAVTLDPSHADAYGRLARGYYYFLFFGVMSPKQAHRLLMEMAEQALRLDPGSAEAYGDRALGRLYYDWDWARAEQDFKRALDLNPNHADHHHHFGHYLMVTNRGIEGLAECRHAVERDPLGLILTACLGWHCLFSREYDAAIEPTLRALRMDPSVFWAHLILGWAYQQRGSLEDAVLEYQTAVTQSARAPITVAALGHAFAVADRRTEAREVLDELKRRAQHTYVSAYDIAAVHIGLGDHDAVFTALDRAYHDRASFLIHIEWDPRFDPIRTDPRFDTLLGRIGLPRIVQPPSAIVGGSGR